MKTGSVQINKDRDGDGDHRGRLRLAKLEVVSEELLATKTEMKMKAKGDMTKTRKTWWRQEMET